MEKVRVNLVSADEVCARMRRDAEDLRCEGREDAAVAVEFLAHSYEMEMQLSEDGSTRVVVSVDEAGTVRLETSCVSGSGVVVVEL